MTQTVSDPHPLQGYINELDALIGQLTTLRYGLMNEVLGDRSAATDSSPTIQCAACGQMTPLRSATCRHCGGRAYTPIHEQVPA